MELSKRLQCVAGMVKSAGVVADIGCDHAFTSIYLIQNKLACKGIAMDINCGPLERAREHIVQYGLEDVIQTRCSNGVEQLEAGEADTLLISGMGGALICNILRARPEVVQQAEELVLSPQSEIHLVRRLLHELGFLISEEQMVEEQGKYYVVIRAVPGQEIYEREEAYRYGWYLIQKKNPVLRCFLQKEKKRVQEILDSLEEKSIDASQRRIELEREREWICWTLKQMSDGMISA